MCFASRPFHSCFVYASILFLFLTPETKINNSSIYRPFSKTRMLNIGLRREILMAVLIQVFEVCKFVLVSAAIGIVACFFGAQKRGERGQRFAFYHNHAGNVISSNSSRVKHFIRTLFCPTNCKQPHGLHVGGTSLTLKCFLLKEQLSGGSREHGNPYQLQAGKAAHLPRSSLSGLALPLCLGRDQDPPTFLFLYLVKCWHTAYKLKSR